MKMLLLTSLFMAGLLLIHSCDKEVELDREIMEAAEEDALATLLFDDILTLVEEAEYNFFQKSEEISTVGETCPLVTVVPTGPEFPKTITIDFGTDGCEDPRGNVRKGKIITYLTGRHFSPGSEKVVSFEDFSVNDFLVDGIKTIVNMGYRENQNMYWTISVDNAVISSPLGFSHQWESNREREWVEGDETPFLRGDDVFEITGNTSGINRFEKPFTVTIVNPLNIAANCRFIRGGSLLIQVEGRPDAILDYGDGSCDNIATITVNGESKRIRLGR